MKGYGTTQFSMNTDQIDKMMIEIMEKYDKYAYRYLGTFAFEEEYFF